MNNNNTIIVPVKYLYDKKGCKLFDQITQSDSYYLTRSEEEILSERLNDIVSQIKNNTVIIELGAGNCKKIIPLLKVCRKMGKKNLTYIPIEICSDLLEQHYNNLTKQFPMISIHPVADNLMTCIPQIVLQYSKVTRFMVIWFGSSIGNLSYQQSILFLKNINNWFDKKELIMLIGFDMWKSPKILKQAYDNPLTAQFIRNGLKNFQTNNNEKGTYIVNVNQEHKRVEMLLSFPDTTFVMEHSHKYTDVSIETLAFRSGFFLKYLYKNMSRGKEYALGLLYSRNAMLKSVWKESDNIFSKTNIYNIKPIPLRNPLLFYIGHVACFGKHIMFNELYDKSKMDLMFQRGIDPNTNDPSQCHWHSELPKQLPSIIHVMNYVNKCRNYILNTYPLNSKTNNWRLHMAIEHEQMHQETFCYLLAQLTKITFKAKLQKIDTRTFQFTSQIYEICYNNNNNQIITIPSDTIIMGLYDDADYFYWDNEKATNKEENTHTIKSFKVDSMPVTNGDYYLFLQKNPYKCKEWWDDDFWELIQQNNIYGPATWSRVPVISNNNTVMGYNYVVHKADMLSYPLHLVLKEPVYVSLAEALAYCRWKQKQQSTKQIIRIMTEPEYCLLLSKHSDSVKMLTTGGWELTQTVFAPLDDGFEVNELYPEYSADFFDGRHYVMKGGHELYTVDNIRRRAATFRNFYQKNYTYMFAKFRCVYKKDC